MIFKIFWMNSFNSWCWTSIRQWHWAMFFWRIILVRHLLESFYLIWHSLFLRWGNKKGQRRRDLSTMSFLNFSENSTGIKAILCKLFHTLGGGVQPSFIRASFIPCSLVSHTHRDNTLTLSWINSWIISESFMVVLRVYFILTSP